MQQVEGSDAAYTWNGGVELQRLATYIINIIIISISSSSSSSSIIMVSLMKRCHKQLS